MKKIVLISLMIAISFTGYTQGRKLRKFGLKEIDVPVGLNVGETAPEFKAYDQNGYLITLNSMLKHGPVVLIFYRGYWCPYCSKALKNYADSIKSITDKGAWFIAVTPETTLGIEKTVDQTNILFSVISDRKMKIMHSYDVAFNVNADYQKKIKRFKKVSIAENNGYSEAVLPVPATYIIDKSGKIVYRQFDYNFKKRASIGEIVANLPK